jgi:hypothetical protein
MRDIPSPASMASEAVRRKDVEIMRNNDEATGSGLVIAS